MTFPEQYTLLRMMEIGKKYLSGARYENQNGVDGAKTSVIRMNINRKTDKYLNKKR